MDWSTKIRVNIIKYSKLYFGSNPEFIDDNLFATKINITNKALIDIFDKQTKQKQHKKQQNSGKVKVADQVSDRVKAPNAQM